jgi:hypothetical protein
MAVVVVEIVHVSMRVLEGPHRVWVRVGLGAFPALVGVLVVLVVDVPVAVEPGLVPVTVPVPLAHQKPGPPGHEARPRDHHGCHALAEQDDAGHGADERGQREVRAGPCRTETPHGEDEEHETGPVAHGAEAERGQDDWS